MNEDVTRRSTTSRTTVHVLAAALLLAGCGRRRAQDLGPSQTGVDGGSAPSPSPTVAASPSPPAVAVPAPEEEPVAEPSPDCIHPTSNGVVSVSLAVYFLECFGERIPGSRDLTQVPVGCRIHFNATPRDGSGAPTCSRTWPIWQVGPEELLFGGGGNTFTPAYTVLASGRMGARCIIDGVRSDWLFLNLVDR